ncbi:MAG: hypothetical protein WDM76_13670 [Limisphaerales bacterium]
MKKASIIGALIFDVYTLAIQIAVQSYHSVGEDLLGLLLFGFWVVAVDPIAMCYQWLGLDWRGNGAGDVGLPAIILIEMFILNACLGSLIGMVLCKLWRLIKRLFSNKECLKI